MRLDSIEFNSAFSTVDEKGSTLYLKSRPYIDTSQNPGYLIRHSGAYLYYLEGENIFLHSMLSSSTYYNKCDFKLSDDKQHFTIKRFYSRNSLPAFIEFERIK